MDSNQIEKIARATAINTYNQVKKSLAQYINPGDQTYSMQELAAFFGGTIPKNANDLRVAWKQLVNSRNYPPATRAAIGYSMDRAGLARDFGVTGVWQVLGPIDAPAMELAHLHNPDTQDTARMATGPGTTSPGATAPTAGGDPSANFIGSNAPVSPPREDPNQFDPMLGLDGNYLPETGKTSAERISKMMKLAAKLSK